MHSGEQQRQQRDRQQHFEQGEAGAGARQSMRGHQPPF